MLRGGNSEAFMLNHAKMFTFLGIFLYVSPAFCQSDIPAALKQLLKERIDAISNKDTSTLNRICTKNYQIINSAGMKMTLSELKTSVIKTETPVKLSTILSYQPFIAEDESMAFATFEIEEEIVKDRQNIIKENLIITEIYKKEKNRWKIQLTHTSQKVCPVAR
jgi:heat shock protein HspQ